MFFQSRHRSFPFSLGRHTKAYPFQWYALCVFDELSELLSSLAPFFLPPQGPPPVPPAPFLSNIPLGPLKISLRSSHTYGHPTSFGPPPFSYLPSVRFFLLPLEILLGSSLSSARFRVFPLISPVFYVVGPPSFPSILSRKQSTRRARSLRISS